jgi:hypothetical protein
MFKSLANGFIADSINGGLAEHKRVNQYSGVFCFIVNRQISCQSQGFKLVFMYIQNIIASNFRQQRANSSITIITCLFFKQHKIYHKNQ